MRKTPWILTVFFFATTALAADFTGTWKLNLQKSKNTGPKVASQTMKIEPTGPNSFRTTIDVTLNSGEQRHQERNRTYDGKEHPAQGVGVPPNQSETCAINNQGERTITIKQDGKVLTEIKSSVSADGRTLTNITTQGGDQVVGVFDKQ